MHRQHFIRAVCATTIALCAGLANAQTQAPLRFVVPYPAGGAADQISRLVTQEMSSILGATVVIENKGGAAGMIAAQAVLNAEADGTTFFVGSNAPLVINSAIYAKMRYDPAKDFVPVVGLGKAPLLLVTRQDLGASTVAALAEMGRKEPGKLNMGSASNGNITHLAGVYATTKLGFKATHVPFQGSAPAITSLMAGDIDIMFDALPSSMQQAKAGRVIPLAVLDSARFPQLPDVPTMSELGFKDLEASAWFGVVAKQGTPKEAMARVNKAVNEALKRPELIEKLRRIGAQPMPGTQAEFAKFVADERARWIPLARDLGIRVD